MPVAGSNWSKASSKPSHLASITFQRKPAANTHRVIAERNRASGVSSSSRAMAAAATSRETHISQVFFTTDRAYKLLKPVRMSFLDLTGREGAPDPFQQICGRRDRLDQQIAKALSGEHLIFRRAGIDDTVGMLFSGYSQSH